MGSQFRQIYITLNNLKEALLGLSATDEKMVFQRSNVTLTYGKLDGTKLLFALLQTTKDRIISTDKIFLTKEFIKDDFALEFPGGYFQYFFLDTRYSLNEYYVIEAVGYLEITIGKNIFIIVSNDFIDDFYNILEYRKVLDVLEKIKS